METRTLGHQNSVLLTSLVAKNAPAKAAEQFDRAIKCVLAL